MKKLKKVKTPIGELSLIADSFGLCSVVWANEDPGPYPIVQGDEILERASLQLQEYFTGTRLDFDLPLRAEGTAFQLRVWRKLSEIPYATTLSYGELAAQVGDSNKARAVGMANGRNPLPIIVPCHRVIGKDGSLTGFGGGLEIKKFLLDWEQAISTRGLEAAPFRKLESVPNERAVL